MAKEIAHADRAHALLSASGASRWLTCTPSARLEEKLPEKHSDYAEEGTLAHEIAELKLRKYYIEPMAQSTYTRRLNKFKKHELYQDEMLKHTDTYLEYLQSITLALQTTPYVAVEKRIDFSHIAPKAFGTVDCLIIAGNTLYVTDFKYGKGVPVSAENNPQMKLYALGAVAEYGFLYPIETIKLAIVQPRLDNISEFELSVSELLAWGEEIKPIAQKAFNGEGDFIPGDHCKFCRAKATCRARADRYTALEDFKDVHNEFPNAELLSNAEIGQILERAQGIENWISSLKEYALAKALKGNEIAGWKAVEGRGSRSFTDIDAAFEHLKANGVDEALLYERVPLTVAKLEKQLKKAQFKELLEDHGFVKKAPGKPTLVPASDKRPSIAPDATQDFAN